MNAKRLLSMILSLVMLASIFVLGTTAAEVSPYKDVKTSRWSYADIMYVTEKGLMNGTTADKFAPAETMTRAMVVTVLYRMEGSPSVEYKAAFSDVKKDKWFTDAVIWASQKQIVNGMGDGKFAPGDGITREQLAAIIMRYSEYKDIITDARADITGYADYKRVHDYARDALSWANAIGLITGVTDTTLSPRTGATREQFAAILHRFAKAEFEYNLVYNDPKLISKYTEKEYPIVKDADIYVAVDGDDSAPGTLDKPVATFERAVEMVRELKKTKTEGGIKVAFKAGNYGRLGLVLTPEDSGTEACPITYCAYGDGDVVFTNGIEFNAKDLVPVAEKDKHLFGEDGVESIYKIDISNKLEDISLLENSMLFGENTFCTEARYPNGNSVIMGYTQKADENAIKFVIGKKLMDDLDSYDGVKLIGCFTYEWLTEILEIDSYDKSTGILTFKKGPENGVSDSYKHCFYFSGSSKHLDRDGEYWIDKDNGELYLFNPTGNYILSTYGTFIYMKEGVSNLSFVGLDFRGTTGDAMFGESCDNITVDRCSIFGTGGEWAVGFSHGNAYKYLGTSNLKVTNCELSCLAGGGIRAYAKVDAYDMVEPDGSLIDNNSIHDYGIIYEATTGISITRFVGTTVSHNEIYNAPRYAVDFNGQCREINFEYNVIHDVMQNSADGGSFYHGRSYVARGNKIRYNLFYDIAANAGSYGIYLDDGMSGQEIYGNLFYDCGNDSILIGGGRDHKIYGNVSISHDKGHDAVWDMPKYYTMGQAGELDEGHFDLLLNWAKSLPKEGTEQYGIWQAKWPEMFSYNFDLTNFDDPNSVMAPVNEIHDNYAIGEESGFEISEITERFGDVRNNLSFSLDENPLFVNPTTGDYRLRDDIDFLNIPFEKMGRY